MMIEREITSFDGVRLRVHRAAAGAGKPALLVSLPFAARPSLCAAAFAHLATAFDVLTWEVRLILDPEAALPDRDALAIAAHRRDALAVLDDAGVAHAAALGYCSGATTALHLAAMRPDRIRKLALVSGAYFLPAGQCAHTQYERDVLALAPLIAAGRGEAAAIFHQFFAGDRAFRKRDHELAHEIYRPYDHVDSFYRFGLCLDHFTRGDTRAAARAVEVPALVATGARDDQTHPASSTQIAAWLPEVERHVDPAADHYALCRGEPDLLARVTRFLA